MELFDWVRAARKSKGLTLEALGAAIGRTKANISQWEHGRYEPGYRQIKLISQVTGYPMPAEIDEVANELAERQMCGDELSDAYGPILKVSPGAGKAASLAKTIDAVAADGNGNVLIVGAKIQPSVWPFESISPERWAALPERAKGRLEAKLETLIEQAEAEAKHSGNRSAA